MDESKIEVNKEVLQEIFKAANMQMPENVSEDAVKNALNKIKSQEIKPDTLQKKPENEKGESTSKNILVIDDIGVVTYQLKIMLRNLGYNVQVARDIFSGINSFVRSNYAFVIMDLFVSTEQEGYTLLNETKKIITKNNLDTKIIVITASNKAENRIKCMNGGADVFLKKETGWQDKLIELVENYNTLEKK